MISHPDVPQDKHIEHVLVTEYARLRRAVRLRRDRERFLIAGRIVTYELVLFKIKKGTP